MLKKLAVLLCALLMAFAVAAAETAVLPTPDYSAELEDFLGEWAVYQGYVDGEWIDPVVSGVGITITEEEIHFHEDGEISFTFSYEYQNGQLAFSDESGSGFFFFGMDGALYLRFNDLYLSFYAGSSGEASDADASHPAPNYTAEHKDFIGNWDIYYIDLGGERTDATFSGIILSITENEILLGSDGDFIPNGYYTYENGQLIVEDDGITMFLGTDGLLHMHSSLSDECITFTRGLASGLPTPDSSATRESFYGTWNEDKEYWHDHWEPAAVSGGGVYIDDSKIYFLMDSVAYKSIPYSYQNGQLTYTDEDYDIQFRFDENGTLYMYEANNDYLVSYYNVRYPGEIIFEDNPFVGEWEAAIVIMFGEILLPADLGFDIGMIVTETEAHSTNAGEVMSTETYVIEDGIAYLSDGVTVLFFDEYGLLHAQSEQLDVICVPAERGIELPE